MTVPGQPSPATAERTGLGVRFLGHSTVLLELDGLRLLTDPFLRGWIGPLRRHGRPPDEGARSVDLVVLATGERRRVLAAASYPRLLDGQLLFGRDDQLLALPFDAARGGVSGDAKASSSDE